MKRTTLLFLVSAAMFSTAAPAQSSRDSDRRSDRYPDTPQFVEPRYDQQWNNRPGDPDRYGTTPGRPNPYATTPGSPNTWAPVPGAPASVKSYQGYNRPEGGSRADDRREDRYETGTRFSGSTPRDVRPPYGTGAGSGTPRR